MNIRRAMLAAYMQASQSPDPSTQNGAVVLDPTGKIVAEGHNYIPGVKDASEIYKDRDLKYKHILHAEVVALGQVKENCPGLTLVCPWAACTECAKVIVALGVSNLIVHKQRMELETSYKWKESIDFATAYLNKSGVSISYLDDPSLDHWPIRVHGVKWSTKQGFWDVRP